MSIAIIYHPEERSLADEWARKFEDQGHEVVLAPLGLEVGSNAWKARVQSDLEMACAALLLLTEKSSMDESVRWRVRVALDAGILVCPIMIGDHERITDQIEWIHLQWLRGDDRALRFLQRELKKVCPPQMFCFISYCRTESEFAKKLRVDLEGIGVRAWRDEDDIPAGSSWDSEIQKALNKSTHVIFVATPHSVESRNVLDELGFAIDKNKVIVPLLLEDCQLPLRVHRAQWVDFRKSYEAGFSELIRNLGIQT